MKATVVFHPAEPVPAAPLAVVIDVLRCTTTICQALASGWSRVICTGEIENARAFAGRGVALAGERDNVKIPGFDLGNSPREFAGPPTGDTLVLTTTNGTRALLTAAASCETVLAASLLNLDAVVAEVRTADAVAIVCAGSDGGFAIDDAYVAGRILLAAGGEWDDAALAAARIAGAYSTPEEGISGGLSAAKIRRVGLGDDIPFSAQESVLDLVPRVVERPTTSVVVTA